MCQKFVDIASDRIYFSTNDSLDDVVVEPPTIDAGRLMPDTLMPITLMPVTIHAHEALLMPVTFDARHF